MKKITRFLSWVVGALGAWGAFGLFAVALLDSALVPLPGGADALMILLSSANPSWMIGYALAATAGSTLGCVILYTISKRAGGQALRKISPEKQHRVERLIARWDVLAVLVASVLPPPFPFKVFVISAGVFRFNLVRFALAVAVGRMFRFGLEGYLAVRYGEQAKEVLARNYPAIGLTVAAILIALFVGKSLCRSRSAVESRG